MRGSIVSFLYVMMIKKLIGLDGERRLVIPELENFNMLMCFIITVSNDETLKKTETHEWKIDIL